MVFIDLVTQLRDFSPGINHQLFNKLFRLVRFAVTGTSKDLGGQYLIEKGLVCLFTGPGFDGVENLALVSTTVFLE